MPVSDDKLVSRDQGGHKAHPCASSFQPTWPVPLLPGGAVATMEASPDMTIGDFKRQLQELQEDESMKEVTIVEVLMGERKLADNEETLTQAGLSPDVVLQVVFTVARTSSRQNNFISFSLSPRWTCDLGNAREHQRVQKAWVCCRAFFAEID